MQDRLLPLDNVMNFRDFGGYPTKDGARVAPVTLWRSASFAGANEADIARLNGLGVRFVVDLRRPEERAMEPNRWPGEGVDVVAEGAEGIEGGLAMPPHLAALLQSDLNADGVRGYMLGAYRGFVEEERYVRLFAEWFRRLDETGGPAVVHCAAGKDRTGFICALTLHVLGVDEEVIFGDYELTNAVVDMDARMPRIRERMQERLGRAISPATLAPMMGVHRDYLHAAFEAVAERAGSLDSYLENTLGVDAARRERLRARYCTR